MSALDRPTQAGRARLTEEEREAIGERICWHCADRNVWDAVESIVAARVGDALAEAERRIEQAALDADLDHIEVHGAHVRRNPYASTHYAEAADFVATLRAELGGDHD